jgi:hypothetical protein
MAFERSWTALARQNSARLWINRLEKSLRLCLAGLRIRRFDPIAEASELADHSRGALLLGLFGDRRAPFFVTNSLVQDQPDQATLSMGNGPDGLVMSQARDRAARHHLEDASFGPGCGVGRLVENAPHVAVAHQSTSHPTISPRSATSCTRVCGALAPEAKTEFRLD